MGMPDLPQLNQIIAGDVRQTSAQLPAACAQTIVTSPPYFGHRRYSETGEGEIGREAKLPQYIANLREALRAAGRLLRDDGTLWLNLGDTFRNGRLLGVPWRVALALEEDGWMLRSDIIWHKPNAMPSAVKTRPTTDHEYIFLFSRSNDYYYDADAIREPHVTFSEKSRMKGGRKHFGRRNGTPEQGKNAGKVNLHDGRWDQAFHPQGRNRRTVWSVPLGKCREAHFAVFPPALILPCILAGSPPGGVVVDPFSGSGVTCLTAQEHGRKFIGFELHQKYVDMARRRLAEAAPPADGKP